MINTTKNLSIIALVVLSLVTGCVGEELSSDDLASVTDGAEDDPQVETPVDPIEEEAEPAVPTVEVTQPEGGAVTGTAIAQGTNEPVAKPVEVKKSEGGESKEEVHAEKKEEKATEEGPAKKKVSFASCGNTTELFSVAPLNSADYFKITPLGNLSPAGHTFPTVHTYLMLTDKTRPAPVYAPGNMTITQIRSVTSIAKGDKDFAIEFAVCAEVKGYFDHVTTLSDKLLAAVGSFSNCTTYDPGDGLSRQCTEEVVIELKAGELIGYAGGPQATLSVALDLGLRDTRTASIFYVNKSRLANADQAYVVCPYDYYPEGTVKQGLFSKLAVARTKSPLCGTVELDRAKTAQGRWYLKGSSWGTSELNHIALVPSNFDPDVGVLSVGHPSLEINPYHFDMRNVGGIRRNFRDVTQDGHIYCYDDLRNRADKHNSQPLSGYLFFKMTDDKTLILERVTSGSCPVNPDFLEFSSQAVTFVR